MLVAWFRLPLYSFFFNDTATTEIYTLSLHDALPIYHVALLARRQRSLAALDELDQVHTEARDQRVADLAGLQRIEHLLELDRKSTRLNSSHLVISYAVFSLKKKNNRMTPLYVCSQHH